MRGTIGGSVGPAAAFKPRGAESATFVSVDARATLTDPLVGARAAAAALGAATADGCCMAAVVSVFAGAEEAAMFACKTSSRRLDAAGAATGTLAADTERSSPESSSSLAGRNSIAGSLLGARQRTTRKLRRASAARLAGRASQRCREKRRTAPGRRHAREQGTC